MREIHFPAVVPPVKGERPGDMRRCTLTRMTVLAADAPWPAEFKRGFAFTGSYTVANGIPLGGRVVVAGQIVARSRDGLRITVQA